MSEGLFPKAAWPRPLPGSFDQVQDETPALGER